MNGEWVAVALLGKPRGNRGELTAISLSSTPERFSELRNVVLDGREYQVEHVWHHQGTLIFKLAGVDSISDAEKLTGCEVRIPAAERVILEPGAYFHSDLIGCTLREQATGKELGRVAAIEEAGGPGILELEDGTLIPFARGICVSIDVKAREILVNLPAGLLDLNKPAQKQP